MSTERQNITVDQSNAQAGGDNVAGNKNTINNPQIIVQPPQKNQSKIEVLIARLKQEINSNSHVKVIIDELQYYHERHATDGIDGLEAKLKHSGRTTMTSKALRQKEAFSKKLAQYAHYATAQEIFAFLLSKIDHLFDVEVSPMLATASVDDVTKVTKDKIIEPIIEEISSDIMGMNHDHVLGMVYWLAEQCFIRWHK